MQLFIPRKNDVFVVIEDITVPIDGRYRRVLNPRSIFLPAGTQMTFSAFEGYENGVDAKFRVPNNGIVSIPVENVNQIKFADKMIENSPPEYRSVYPIPDNYQMVRTQIEFLNRFIRKTNGSTSSWVWCATHNRLSSDSAARLWRKGILKRQRRNSAEYRLTMAGYRLYLLQGGNERHNKLEQHMNNESMED